MERIVHVLVLGLHWLRLESAHVRLEALWSRWLGRLLGLLWLGWRIENIVKHVPRRGGWLRLSYWLLRSRLLGRELLLDWLLLRRELLRLLGRRLGRGNRTEIAPVISAPIICACCCIRCRRDRLRRSEIKQILHIIVILLNLACGLGRHSLPPWGRLRLGLNLLRLWLLLRRTSREVSS